MWNAALLFLTLGVLFLFIFFSQRWGKEALIALIALQGVMANLFVTVQFPLFSWYSTAGDPFAIGQFFGLSILQKRYGKDASKLALAVCFLGMLFFAVTAFSVLGWQQPSLSEIQSIVLRKWLGFCPRMVCASLITMVISGRLAVFLLEKGRSYWPNIPFNLLTSVTLIIACGVDTVIFTLLGLYGILDHLTSIMLTAFFLKSCMILLFPLFWRLFQMLSPRPHHARM